MDQFSAIDFISLIASIFAVLFSAITYLANVTHDRKQHTLEAYNLLQEQVLDKLQEYTAREIAEISKNKFSEEYKRLSTYIARIEHFAVGVNEKIYDCKTVYKLAHGFLDGSVRNKIEPIIRAKESELEGNYYQNIKILYQSMDKLKSRCSK